MSGPGKCTGVREDGLVSLQAAQQCWSLVWMRGVVRGSAGMEAASCEGHWGALRILNREAT